ncbi:hypothetical protein GQX73_g5044 [Xylaria multiplex]|uniref:F-box domain-containing protein n=1 Tax=Xylaria multiplex TaxID=323545 RepID=A0A7C8IRP9_9PEZI|nr:hypothetical protein GQX73_g5044 [Xylaria multiplex]
MAPSLEALPLELFEMVVVFLDFKDIACLRLASRTTEIKASQMHFVTFFHRKQVTLHARRLDDLVRMTASSRLVCCLQQLTIVGPVGLDEARSEYRADEHVNLLAQAFRNIKAKSQTGSLASLSLRAAAVSSCPDTLPWSEFWVAARRTFKVTMEALYESNLSVTENLDIFSSVTGYSLEYDAFGKQAIMPAFLSCLETWEHKDPLWPAFNSPPTKMCFPASQNTNPSIIVAFTHRWPPTNAFTDLKRLTFSLSSILVDGPVTSYRNFISPNRLIKVNENQGEHTGAALEAVSQLSEIMPKLESLHLQWRNVGENAAPLTVLPMDTLNGTSRPAPLQLKECSLGGVFVRGAALTKFVKSMQPEIFKMRGVHLLTGTYAHLFKYLEDPDTPTTSYHLEDIFQKPYRLVHFNVPGTTDIEYEWYEGTGVIFGPSTLSRQNANKGKQITYRVGPQEWSDKNYLDIAFNVNGEFGAPYSESRAPIKPMEVKNDVDIGYRYL